MKTKLVRDKIPNIIMHAGGSPRYYGAEVPEYEARLISKMAEELHEFRENPCIEEAADMYAVLSALCGHWGWTMEEVRVEAEIKQRHRGGFDERYVLNLEPIFEADDDTEDWLTTSHGEKV